MEKSKGSIRGGKRVPEKSRQRSAAIAASGVRTASDFARLMSAIMSDVISEAMDPRVANAAVNAGGKLLKVVELQQVYGRPDASGAKILGLAE
jgi:hypothetical protein